MTVTIYSTTYCPYCVMAKDYLRQHSIPFQEINLTEHPEHIDEMIEKSGQTGVPVLDIDGQIIVGFNRNAIKNALKLKD